MNAVAARREELLRQAREIPIEDLDVSNWHLFEHDAIWPYFERLRREDPVHLHRHSRYGPFWSITRYEDIKWVDSHRELFSSEGSISLLAHGENTRDMVRRPLEYLGNLILLIVGGNDTTRNSISGGVLALDQFPEQYDKLRADPGLIPNMVSEIIRWQTPLAYMRRNATEDVELGGKTIRRGDKVVMWYVSGNRDEAAFEDADRLIIDRPNARSHLSFGYGIHRCMGNRVAELQLRLLWEEIMERFHAVEVVGEPVRNRHLMVRGYTELPVRLVPR